MYSTRKIGLLILVLALGAIFLSGGMAFADGEWIFSGPIYIMVPWDIDSSGTFDSMTAKVPDIADLGANTVHLLPIFKHHTQGGPYYVLDFYLLYEPHGTWTDLQELITATHNNQMKILFDMVPTWTPEKKYPWQEQSWIYLNHPEWILRDPQTGEMLYTYPDPWGWALDQIHPGVIDYFTGVGNYYVQNYNIDGWRIDAPRRNYDPAKFPEPRYSTDLLRSVKTGITGINPNVAMLSEFFTPEVWTPGADPLFDEMAEMSYDHELRYWLLGPEGKAVTNSAGGTSAELVNLVNNEVVWYGRGRARFLESHDTDRLAYLLQNAGRVNSNNPLITLISTLHGTPMIRSGQEVRATDRSWTQVPWPGDTVLRDFYKKVFAVRKVHPVLNSGRGTLTNIWTSGDNAVAYARIAAGASAPVGNDGVIVLLNFFYASAPSALTFKISIPGLVPSTNYQLYDLITNTVVDTATGAQLGNNYTVYIPAYGAQVIKLIPDAPAPPPNATYNCSSITVNNGSIIAGSHTNLHANDGSYLQIRAGGILTKKIDWDANVTIDQAASQVKKLRITYDGKYSASRTQYLKLYNFTTSQWDTIDERTVGTTDITITWSVTDPAVFQKYISSTKQIKLKVYAQNSSSFDCYGDYVQYYIEYTP